MARQGVTPSLTPSSFDTFESRSNLLIYSSTRMALLFTSFHLYYYVRDSSPRRISLTISRTNGPEIRIESGDVSEGLFSATTPGDQRRPRERTRGTRDRHDRFSRWFFIGNRSRRILFTFSPLPLPPPMPLANVAATKRGLILGQSTSVTLLKRVLHAYHSRPPLSPFSKVNFQNASKQVVSCFSISLRKPKFQSITGTNLRRFESVCCKC